MAQKMKGPYGQQGIHRPGLPVLVFSSAIFLVLRLISINRLQVLIKSEHM